MPPNVPDQSAATGRLSLPLDANAASVHPLVTVNRVPSVEFPSRRDGPPPSVVPHRPGMPTACPWEPHARGYVPGQPPVSQDAHGLSVGVSRSLLGPRPTPAKNVTIPRASRGHSPAHARPRTCSDQRKHPTDKPWAFPSGPADSLCSRVRAQRGVLPPRLRSPRPSSRGPPALDRNVCRNRARASRASISKTPDRVLLFTALFVAISPLRHDSSQVFNTNEVGCYLFVGRFLHRQSRLLAFLHSRLIRSSNQRSIVSWCRLHQRRIFQRAIHYLVEHRRVFGRWCRYRQGRKSPLSRALRRFEIVEASVFITITSTPRPKYAHTAKVVAQIAATAIMFRRESLAFIWLCLLATNESNYPAVTPQ